MSAVPRPPDWMPAPGDPFGTRALVRDPGDPHAPRLVAHVEFAASVSLAGWRDEVVSGLARALEDWTLLDVGTARVAGTRGIRVLGCSAPPGRPARIHETWCAVRERHRCTATLTAGVRDYDDVVDEVAAAVADWTPSPGEGC